MKKFLLIVLAHCTLSASAQNVGVGTSIPQEKLDVNGGIKVGNSTGNNDGTLRWNNNHLQVFSTGYWITLDSTVSLYGWTRTGNSGTKSDTNFIGTIDNVGLTFKVNNNRAGFLDPGTNSVFYGIGAGSSNTLGNNNTLIGYNSFKSNLVGSNATSIGANAMLYANNTTTSFTCYNVAVGFESLRGSTTPANNIGNYNTGIGYQTLWSNTSGNYNSANGMYALRLNTTGNYNTSDGAYALYSNTTGIYNTASGAYALYSNTTGNYNSASGSNSLRSNTTGSNNTANGYQALRLNVTGYGNLAEGMYALYSNTTGYYNSASGYQALYSNTTGFNNTAYGYQAIYSNITGYNNCALGYHAFRSNTTGYENTAVGYFTNYYSVVSSGNTAVGFSAGGNYNNGSDNTFIGAYTGANAASYSNSTVLGSNTSMTASNQVRVGNTSVTSVGGQVGWTTLSDARIKRNIQNNVSGLEFILKLRPVTYNIDVVEADKFLGLDGLKSHTTTEEIEAKSAKSKIVYSGFIAQEVEAAAKQSTYEFSGVDAPKNDKDLYGIRYAEFVVPLVKAVQEQQAIINEMKLQIETLSTELYKLKSLK